MNGSRKLLKFRVSVTWRCLVILTHSVPVWIRVHVSTKEMTELDRVWQTPPLSSAHYKRGFLEVGKWFLKDCEVRFFSDEANKEIKRSSPAGWQKELFWPAKDRHLPLLHVWIANVQLTENKIQSLPQHDDYPWENSNTTSRAWKVPTIPKEKQNYYTWESEFGKRIQRCTHVFISEILDPKAAFGSV